MTLPPVISERFTGWRDVSPEDIERLTSVDTPAAKQSGPCFRIVVPAGNNPRDGDAGCCPLRQVMLTLSGPNRDQAATAELPNPGCKFLSATGRRPGRQSLGMGLPGEPPGKETAWHGRTPEESRFKS